MRNRGIGFIESGGSSIWTPAQLSNKIGWWSASDITGKSDGDSVTAWPDSFGLLSDATGSGTYRTGANGIGGQPALEFNGSSNFFQTGYTGTPTDFFVAGVFTLGASANMYERVIDKDYVAGFWVGRRLTNAGLAAGALNATNNSLSYSAPAYFFFGRSGTSSIFEVNTLTRTDSVATTALSATQMLIGKAAHLGGTEYLEGKIGFLLALDAYPSAGDLTNLRTYITDTYGITTS